MRDHFRVASFFALSEYHSPLIHRSAPVFRGVLVLLVATFRNNYQFSDRIVIIAYSVLYFHSIFMLFGEKPLLPRKVRPKNLHLPGMWPLLADIHENCLSKTFSEAFQNPISHFPSDKPSFSRQVLFQQIELMLFLVFVRGSSSVRSSPREFLFPQSTDAN